MASFGKTINSNENRSEFTPIKPGWYHMEIVGGDVKKSSNNGAYVEFTFRVAEGECANRRVFGRFNIVNASQEAERIGKQQLIALADAVGITDPSDTDPFLGKHVMANVTVRPATDRFAESNDIRGYRKFEGTYTPSAPSAPSQGAPESAPSVGRPDWLTRR